MRVEKYFIEPGEPGYKELHMAEWSDSDSDKEE